MNYALLGAKLAHSHSPRIHKLLAGYDYSLMEVTPEELESVIRGKAYKGLNVTIPYKVDALRLCDKLTDSAVRIGSVNTITLDGANIVGDNTDLHGFLDMLRFHGISLSGAKVLVLGSGGSSRTVVEAAKICAAREIVVVSRAGLVDYEAAKLRHADADIIVNTTPVGMYPRIHETPIELDGFARLRAVVDIIYNPLRTRLLIDANSRGLKHCDGLYMLVSQAAKSSMSFTGGVIASGKVDEVYRELLLSQVNIVLVGMPGSGKTTIGRLLADELGKPFVDMDDEIEKRSGKTIPSIFEEYGEKRFREIERQTTLELSATQSQVIATGGGCPMNDENVIALRQNGIFVWVKRDVENLATQGRPLSKDMAALRVMAGERNPRYSLVSDIEFDNNMNIPSAGLAKLVERIYNHMGNEGRRNACLTSL